eukprot:345282-Prorocentrum_lima.AAC.1
METCTVDADRENCSPCAGGTGCSLCRGDHLGDTSDEPGGVHASCLTILVRPSSPGSACHA